MGASAEGQTECGLGAETQSDESRRTLVPTAKAEEDHYASSKLQYRDRLSYIRSSLETKKKEIESALSDSSPSQQPTFQTLNISTRFRPC